MAKRSVPADWRPLMASILVPTGIGISLYLCVMSLVEGSGSALALRYLAGHPVSKITTALALIGLVALIQTARRVVAQYSDSAEYPPANAAQLSPDDFIGRARALRDLIGRTSRNSIGYYRQQRLIAATKYVEQSASADRLDDELKYLSDIDSQRQSDGYGFVRILIWAIPMLGFLGTVLGITQALGSIQVGPDNDFQRMMDGLRTGLYVAFDTTAQALSFSIGLMFVQFVVVRCENQLLENVDRRVRQDLSGWFVVGTDDADRYVRTVQRLARSVLAATHEMSQTQIELWKRSIESAQAAWLEALQGNHEIVQQNLGDAIESSVDRMGQRLDDSIRRADAALEHRGQQWLIHLSQMARQTHEQQQQVVTSTQAVLAALQSRQAVPTSPHSLLESSSLSRTLQGLNQSLDAFNSHLARLGAQGTKRPSGESDAKSASPKKSLRVFHEDNAA